MASVSGDDTTGALYLDHSSKGHLVAASAARKHLLPAVCLAMQHSQSSVIVQLVQVLYENRS